MSTLVFVEQTSGTIGESSLAAMTLGRGLGEPVEAVLMGRIDPAARDELSRYGADRIYQIEHDLLADYAPEAWGAALHQMISATGPNAVLAAGTDIGNEVLAHVAARADQPMAANCTEISPDGAAWMLTRARWGGMLLEDARLTADIKLATVAPIAVRHEPAPVPADAATEMFIPDLDSSLARTRVVDRTTRDAGVSLTTARVVVSGGRGVGSAEGFSVLEELAGELGGAVGCSRVATNNGWRSHSDQVGQTGTRISPELYIACGISGATQHWAGCMGSKKILAINKDPEAPLVQRADYAVIGDLHEVLPALLEEVRKRKGAPVTMAPA